jgi:hypothetical protein
MSKPAPVEYLLHHWEITYSSQYYESSRQTGEQHYMAIIKYVAAIDGKNVPHLDQKHFVTFEEAKAWIDKELQS